MRIEAAVRGRLSEHMARETAITEAGVTSAVAKAAEGLKGDLRSHVKAAGLGEKLANSIRSAVYPKGRTSIEAAGLVWTKAPNILEGYELGATLRAKTKRLLAIPTADTPKKRNGQALSPDEVEKRFNRKLRFIPADASFSTPSIRAAAVVGYLVLDNLRIRRSSGRWRNASQREINAKNAKARGLSIVIMFTLTAQVKLRKRLDIRGHGEAWAARLPAMLVAELERADEAAKGR
jgi:hypothetical protein